jgi:MFS family permease
MFLITAAFGFLQPFVPLYMEAAGLTRDQIGLVVGVGTGLALLVQPMLGRMSDRLDARRPIMAVAAVGAALAYGAYRWADSPVAFGLLSAIGVNGTIFLNAAAAVIVARLAVAGASGRAYAAYRVWGSVGYIVVALATGWVIGAGGAHAGGSLTRSGLAPVFEWGPMIFVAIAVLTAFVPDPKANPSAQALRGMREDDSATDRTRASALRPFLVSFFLYQFALYGASAYLSLFIKGLGATPLWITGTFAAGVVCEVLVMTRVGGLSDARGRKPILAVAYVLMPIRLLCYIPATGPAWVLAVQLLHGLNFGIMGAVAVTYVNDLAPDGRRGAAQASLSSVGGLAVALGPALCGLLSHRLGIGWMFAAMSVVGMAGAIIFLYRVPESHHPTRAVGRR